MAGSFIDILRWFLSCQFSEVWIPIGLCHYWFLASNKASLQKKFRQKHIKHTTEPPHTATIKTLVTCGSEETTTPTTTTTTTTTTSALFNQKRTTPKCICHSNLPSPGLLALRRKPATHRHTETHTRIYGSKTCPHIHSRWGQPQGWKED